MISGKPRVVQAGNFKKIPINTNVYPVGNPTVVLAGEPKVCIPGQGTFSLPKTRIAIDSPFIAGIPEIIIAKEPFSKDQNPQNFSIYGKLQGLNYVEITSMLEDKIGNLWFGTAGGGVSKYDGKSFTHFTEQEGLSSNYVWSMLEDDGGNIWFGTSGGVNKYDGRGFTHFTEQEGLSNNFVLSILEDRSGNLWFGTLDGGVNKYDGKNFVHYTDKEGLSYNDVRSILEDRSGNLWFGTQNGGVNIYDYKNFIHLSEKDGLSPGTVFSILEEKSGHIWFGTRFGLNKLVIDKLNNFTNQTALSTPDNTSSVANESGIFFKTYTYEDGFSGIGVNAGITLYEAKDGTIWIGAGEKLSAFHPEDEIPDTTRPNIQLTGLAIINENNPWPKLGPTSISEEDITVQTAFGDGWDGKVDDTIFLLGNGVKLHNFRFDGLSRWYGVPENLSLSYDNNHITFQYVGINTQSPKKIKYQYQLEGIDSHWSGITDRGEASYGNLPHGRYTFKVRAMNGDGIWSSELQYPFEIRPPWWLTRWAQTLYAVMGLGLLFGLRKYTVNRERIKHALKIQKLETEKMQEVDHLKSRFFANISHEFRTPLTLILGPLERFVSQTPAESPERPVFQMMQRNARRLLHLINQLLDLSKIETGSMKMETKPADLVSFLKSMVLSFSSLAERRQIKYHFQHLQGHPVVYFDGDKLRKDYYQPAVQCL